MSWVYKERTEPDGTKVYWCLCRWQGHEFQVWVSPCDSFPQPAWQWVCYSSDGQAGVHLQSDSVYSGSGRIIPQSLRETQEAAERILTAFGFTPEPMP